jgi:ubiquitin-activating enzyme E1
LVAGGRVGWTTTSDRFGSSGMTAAEWTWGQWMGAWKAEAGAVDVEQDRLSRMHAAMGADTGAKIKDINVLVIGCRGTGVEAAKNLILSNVGSVMVWDPAPATIKDMGANFYLRAEDVGKARDSSCIGQLKGLNPYCKVDVLKSAEEALPSALAEANVHRGKGYAAVIVTTLLPEAILVAMNEAARAKSIAFLLALNAGVTASVFSDFGDKHAVTDHDGEPTEMLALSGVDIVPVGGIVKVDGCKEGDKVLVATLASDHGLSDGDLVVLDDMRGDLSAYNGKRMKVKRFCFLSPNEAKLDTKAADTKALMGNPTAAVLDNFAKVYEHFKEEFKKSGKDGKFPVRTITMFNRLVLELEDGQSFDQWKSYQSGGLVNSQKPVLEKEYVTFQKSLVETVCPQMMDQELSLMGEGCWIQLALAAALKFQATKKRWPGLMNEADADEFVTMAKAISEERKTVEGACWLQQIEFTCPSGNPLEDLSGVEKKLKQYSLLFESELTGFCAFLGGLIAQEVIKVTGKFMPIEQWIHHYDGALLAPGSELSVPETYKDTRYAYQATIIGQKQMEEVRSQNIFLVGVGALGCEYVKGIALMGGCTAPGSKCIITDMDKIEVSNLSRQFLFRQPDVGSAKSTTAAKVVKGWNPDLNIEALEKGVGDTSEDYFDDAFWQRLSLCWNALDNVKARKYTDRCCLWYGMPLLESGTLGTKTNSDVFLPKLTKSYNDGTEDDANETQIAMCTLRSFPYLPLHCIEFAKQSYFSDYLEFAPTQYESFRQDPTGFFEQLDNMGTDEQQKSLTMIKEFIEIQKSGSCNFDTCVKQAFKHYTKDFITSIRDLIYHCDELEKAKGVPFWTGTKRKPKEAAWNSKKPPAEALEYLYACANCYAFIFGVAHVRNREEFEKKVVALDLQVPAWSPPGGSGDVEDEAGPKVDPQAVEKLKGELYAMVGEGLSSLAKLEAHDFEKDDDSNFHVDFLTIGTNLRSANYDIKASDRAHVKVTAGKIIPALATTTAMVCGLVDNEFLKLAMGLHKGEKAVDQFYNCNINLATGSGAINSFRPDPPITQETKLTAITEFTSWDKVVVEGEITVEALVQHLEKKYGCKVGRLHPIANDKDAIYDSVDVAKMEWTIEWRDGKLAIEPEQVFTAWPQLKMASQMIAKLPEGGARKNFENQVNGAKKSLDAVKANFMTKCKSPVSEAYVNLCRPADDDEKKKYFDAVHAKRSYIAFGAYLKNADGEEAHLPTIKYVFRK